VVDDHTAFVESLNWATKNMTETRDYAVVTKHGHEVAEIVECFETDWDPYIDDAIDVVGAEHFVDWMQHTVESEKVVAYIEALGLKKFDKNDPAYDETLKRTSAVVKEVIQSVQTPAVAYFNALSSLTIPQIKKAQHVDEAFQRVLDNPAAQEALQHPALKPLLEQAAD
jgi:hypothetical protein